MIRVFLSNTSLNNVFHSQNVIFTESQNSQKFLDWKGCLEIIQTICSSMVSQRKLSFWVSPVETPTSLGNLFQSFTALTVEECSLVFRWNCKHLYLCPLVIFLSLCTTKTAWFHHLYTLPSDNLYVLIRISLTFLFSRLKNPSFLHLSSEKRCSSP